MILRGILILAIWGALALPRIAQSQWRLISSFNDSPRAISWGNPAYVLSDNLYRSTNFGMTWAASLKPIYGRGIATKDSLTAWLSTSEGCQKTTDGGLTWRVVDVGSAVAVQYMPVTGQLFLSRWLGMPAKVSTDEGQSWSNLDVSDRNGFAFSNDLEGVAAKVVASDHIAITSDGGRTWTGIPFPHECWQPAAIAGTQTYFMAAEEVGLVFKSSDGGFTWAENISLVQEGLTGTIMIDQCDNAYLQTQAAGVHMSSDEGLSWKSIGGPSNQQDTRFYLQQGKLICGGHIGSELGIWQYVGPPLQLIIPDTIELASCRDTTFSVDYSFSDFCVGANAEFITGSITGSEDFEVVGDFLPREIQAPQNISVRYRPRAAGYDTSRLTLTFWTGNVTFDTTVTFIGRSTAKQDVNFELSASLASVDVGKEVTVDVRPSRLVRDAGLTTLNFTLEYHDDHFRLIDATSPIAAIIGSPRRLGDKLVLPVSASGKDVVLDPSQPILQLHLATRLADSIRSKIELTGLTLNGGDVEFQNCTLSASSTSAEIEIPLNCGDNIIRRVLRGEKALEIKSISPNPTQGSITIDYESKLEGALTLTVYSVGGVLVHEQVIASDPQKPLQLDTSGWPSGAYTIVLKSGEEEASASLIKN